MKKRQILTFAGPLAVLFFALHATALADPPRVGESFPEIVLPAPEDMGARSYLGLKDAKEFRVEDIAAKVVIVEIFSMYCPYCQAEAPTLNVLFEKIEGDPAAKGKVKMIGIGAGNSTFEVNFFKEKFEIPFPLFADDDFSIHETIGSVRTPYFVVVKLAGPGKGSVVFSEAGSCGGAADFLKKVKDLGGI